MTSVLDRDWSARMAARFSGRLYAGSLILSDAGVYDAADPTGAPTSSPTTYACQGIALGYDSKFSEGSRVKKADYQVMVMRGTIGATVAAIAATIDLAGATDIDTVIRAADTGEEGNTITVEIVADADAAAGELEEDGADVILHVLGGVTTVAELEALIGTSTLIAVGTPGTGAMVVESSDALARVALAGGADATVAVVNVVPAAGDTINIPPPGQTVAARGAIVNVSAVTEAFVTLDVQGPL